MTDLTNQSIGRYHILEQLGQGGMATVYKAYDTRLEREVAIKVIRTDAFPPAVLDRVLKRFEREARSLARLSDPYIVKVYDFGEYEGSPYLLMELHKGGTLKERLGKPINSREAAELLLPVAKALAYAHAHGVLHRDVKPSNILINERGEAVLTDFGIAKLLEGEEGHTLTGTGVGIGTPEYMAPEQGLGSQIDGRADIYSLGVVFYELLTGKKPFQAETPLAVLFKQMNDPLPRPKQFIPDLPDEVERVIFKALAKKPEDRYETMAAFAAALEGLVHVQPVSAPVPQLHEQKIASKIPELEHLPLHIPVQPSEPETVDMLEPQQGNQPGSKKRTFFHWLLPALVGIGILIFALPKIFPIQSISNTSFTEPGQTTITSTSAAILPTGTTAVTLDPAATASVDLDMYTSPFLGPVPEGALMRLGKGTAFKAIFYPDGTTIAVASSLGIYLYNFETLDLINFFATKHPITAISVSPDGTMLASALGNNTINLMDTRSGELLHTFEGHMYSSLAFSPDSSTLASATFDSNMIILWDSSSGEKLRTLTGHTSSVTSVAFSPDGSTLASGSHDNTVRLWDASSGEQIRTHSWHIGTVSSVTFSPDGSAIASGANDRTVFIVDVKSGEKLHSLTSGFGDYEGVTCVAYSPDGSTLASSWEYGTLTLWDVNSDEERTLNYPGVAYAYSSYNNLAFSPDGTTLLNGSGGNSISLWDVKSGEKLRTIDGFSAAVEIISFFPDGTTLASASSDNTRIIWDTKSGEKINTGTFYWYSSNPLSLAFPPDTSILASVRNDLSIVLWDFLSGEELLTLRGHTDHIGSVAFSPDGSTLASGSYNGEIILWNSENGEKLHTLARPGGYARTITFSPDGTTFASMQTDGMLILWDTLSGKMVYSHGYSNYADTITFSPDGNILAIKVLNKIILCDAHSGEEITTLINSPDNNKVTSILFSPDSRTFATTFQDGPAILWNTSSGEQLFSLSSDSADVVSVTFSPDGNTLAAGGNDGIITLWDAKSGQKVRTFAGHTYSVPHIAFSPDGSTLASGSRDGTIIFWDLEE